MQIKNLPLVQYVYRCTACGHAGKLHLVESVAEQPATCIACGASVVAEWDGGVGFLNDERSNRKLKPRRH